MPRSQPADNAGDPIPFIRRSPCPVVSRSRCWPRRSSPVAPDPRSSPRKSQQKLSSGDIWRAWQLATRALDREPMNPKAKDAAAAAGRVIADDWERKITALAPIDSVQAAEQVLEFTQFRTNAINYTTIEVSPAWAVTEHTLRMAAARNEYLLATQAKSAHRPKAAFAHFHAIERFVPNYKDASQQAERTYQAALTQVAVLPFASGSDPELRTRGLRALARRAGEGDGAAADAVHAHHGRRRDHEPHERGAARPAHARGRHQARPQVRRRAHCLGLAREREERDPAPVLP
jgi:hypothetical protein